MAVWFELEKTEKGIRNFLESNWEFHDFRLERIEYNPIKDLVEMFFKYDTMVEGVLLRFVGIHDAHVNIEYHRDYDTAWLSGSVVLLLENDFVIWLDDDGWGDATREHLDEIKKDTTWVEARNVFWAVTDGHGNPVEMPSDRINQVWNIYGMKKEKHFELKEFDGDWDLLLNPFQGR